MAGPLLKRRGMKRDLITLAWNSLAFLCMEQDRKVLNHAWMKQGRKLTESPQHRSRLKVAKLHLQGTECKRVGPLLQETTGKGQVTPTENRTDIDQTTPTWNRDGLGNHHPFRKQGRERAGVPLQEIGTERGMISAPFDV